MAALRNLPSNWKDKSQTVDLIQRDSCSLGRLPGGSEAWGKQAKRRRGFPV